MGIRIGRDKTKTQVFNDPLVGVKIEFTWRRPNTDEQLAFQVDSLRREGDQVINDRFGASLRHMRPAIVSFRFPDPDKAITLEKDGEYVPLSRVKNDPGFQKDWYKLLLEYIPGIMLEVGTRIFGAVLIANPEKEEAPANKPAPKKEEKGAEEEAPN